MNNKLIKFLKKISEGAVKYEDPRYVKLCEIDPKIRKVIKSINRSNWCWTVWSCQGHIYENGSITQPYLTFILKNNKVDKFLNLIYQTLPIYKSREFPVASIYNLQIHRGYNDKFFSMISIYWSSSFITSHEDNFNFYSDLKYLGKQIRHIK